MTPNLSLLELQLLSALRNQRLHGHALWQLLSAQGASRSSVYEALRRLHRLGLLVASIETTSHGPARHRWHITPRGRKLGELSRFSYRQQLAGRLRSLVAEYRIVLTELSTPLVGEESVPYTPSNADATRQVFGDTGTNSSNMRVDGITLGVISETPTVLPNLNSAIQAPGVTGEQA